MLQTVRQPMHEVIGSNPAPPLAMLSDSPLNSSLTSVISNLEVVGKIL